MHALERAIVEHLKLEKGDRFMYAYNANPGIGITGTFVDLIYDEESGSVVLVADVQLGNRQDGEIFHTAIDVKSLCQIYRPSGVTRPRLVT